MLAKQLIVSSTLHAAGDTAATLGSPMDFNQKKRWLYKVGYPGSSYNLGYNSYNWGYPIIRPFVVQDNFFCAFQVHEDSSSS